MSATLQKVQTDPAIHISEDDSEFQNQLQLMNLKEMMALEKEAKDQADKDAAVLRAVKTGQMDGLKASMKQGAHEVTVVSGEEVDKQMAVIQEKHLRNEKALLPIREGENPDQALETTKQWLKDTFGNHQADAILVHDNKGNRYVAALGVSADEIEAAGMLQKRQLNAQKRAAEVHARIQDKIHEGMARTDRAAAVDDVPRAAVTPTLQRQPASQGRTV